MSHQHICKHLLEIILGIKIHKLMDPSTEKAMKIGYESKGIRLDVYVEDDKNTVYDIEMQVRQYSGEILGHRTRYYQSAIDFDALQRGAQYDKLKKSIIIFICPFRLFESDRHVFTFRTTCQEDTAILLDDGTSKIFLSTKGTMRDDITPEVKSFLDFVDGLPVQDAFVNEVRELIRNMKTIEREKANYMTFQMKINEERAEARNEGRAEGRAEGESRLSRLMTLLLENGKADEALAASKDADIRNELYARYGIA